MRAPYNHKAIEQKWRSNWQQKPVNVNDGKKPKYYCLDMFPYPSGNGLHVGHWRYYVIHPMGWDAFGLPAENYAIKMGVHPAKSTAENVANIKNQINDIAAIYDWDMEVNTTDPAFYKWTQWIFVKMFKEGLAYEKEFPINWCPSCKTGLANEEVVNGCCERCGAEVTKKNLRQWMLKPWTATRRGSPSTPQGPTPSTEPPSWSSHRNTRWPPAWPPRIKKRPWKNTSTTLP